MQIIVHANFNICYSFDKINQLAHSIFNTFKDYCYIDFLEFHRDQLIQK